MQSIYERYAGTWGRFEPAASNRQTHEITGNHSRTAAQLLAREATNKQPGREPSRTRLISHLQNPCGREPAPQEGLDDGNDRSQHPPYSDLGPARQCGGHPRTWFPHTHRVACGSLGVVRKSVRSYFVWMRLASGIGSTRSLPSSADSQGNKQLGQRDGLHVFAQSDELAFTEINMCPMRCE